MVLKADNVRYHTRVFEQVNISLTWGENMYGKNATKIQIYVSRGLKILATKRAEALGFKGLSEYVRALIRADLLRSGYLEGERRG